MTMTQPRLMKRVASILLASGRTWGRPPPPRLTLPRSHLYSSSRRFPVVPSLTLGFPHKIPNRASATPGLLRCSMEISNMAAYLHSQGLSCHVLTPKIGTGKGLTCGPSLVTKYHSAGKISSEDSVKMLAVGNTPSFDKRTVCACKR
jgi:hypothetical protein